MIFTVRDAAAHAKLSPHMVAYLCREGVVRPNRRRRATRGSRRTFRLSDV